VRRRRAACGRRALGAVHGRAPPGRWSPGGPGSPRARTRSIALFVAAALAEIGGAYLVWIGLKEDRGVVFVVLGVVALGIYGVVASFQPSNEFGCVLAAYGGVFIVGSIVWGVAFDGFHPDRYDLIGAAICLLGVGTIMYAPR
jgi:small multidrug resistance family-3 protein